MKKIVSLFFIISAIAVYYFLSTSPEEPLDSVKGRKNESAQNSAVAQDAASQSKTPQEGGFLDYATGKTAVKQFHTAKDKINKYNETREKQLEDL